MNHFIGRTTPLVEDKYIHKYTTLDTNSNGPCIVKLVKCTDIIPLKELLHRRSYLQLDIDGCVRRLVLLSLPVKYTYTLHLGADVKVHSTLQEYSWEGIVIGRYQVFDFSKVVDEEFVRVREMCTSDIHELMSEEQISTHLNMAALSRRFLYARLDVEPNEDDYRMHTNNLFTEDEYVIVAEGLRRHNKEDALEEHNHMYTLYPNRSMLIPYDVQLRKIRVSVNSTIRVVKGVVHSVKEKDSYVFRFTDDATVFFDSFSSGEDSCKMNRIKTLVSGVHKWILKYFPNRSEINEDSLNTSRVASLELILKEEPKEDDCIFITYYNVCI